MSYGNSKLVFKTSIFQSIIDAIPLGLFWIDTDHRLLGSNKKQSSLFGLSSLSGWVGLSLSELVQSIGFSPDTVDDFHRVHSEIFRIQKGKTTEYTNIDRKNPDDTYLLYREPLFDDNGELVGLIGVSINATEFKDTIQQLIKTKVSSDHIFQNIIDTFPVLLFWTDKNHVYQGNNQLHATAFGYERPQDLVGVPMIESLKHVGFDDALYEQICEEHQEIMDSKVGKIIEYDDVVLSDKKKVAFLSHKTPLFDENDQVIGVTGVSMDITELKIAQKQAEAASKAKSEFIANMSHDLRTPTHGVSGMQDLVLMAADKAEVILEDKEASAQQLRDAMSEFVYNVKKNEKTAQRSTGQLIELFNQILESVSLDEGSVEESAKVFNLPDLIERNVLLLQSAALHKKLELTYCIDERVPEYVCGLPIYLDRCIGNLLSNALKFTHQGSIHIDVGLLEQPDGISADQPLDKSFTLMIRVRDTGIGIAEDKRKEIFKPFTRLTNSFDGVYKGSGLGLATVKQYVEKMQGTIELKSEVGQGTTFTIEIPVTVSETISQQDLGSDKSHRVLNPNLIEREAIDIQNRIALIKNVRRRLLVVEDNEPAAVFAQACLSSDTCLVDIAGSGGEALELVQRNHYHLIFMDIGLPDIAGIEVIRRIRQLADTQKGSVPIVALTGHAFSKEKRQTFFAMGVSGVLSKPASESELKSMLEQCIQ